jgi:hypothetical protein
VGWVFEALLAAEFCLAGSQAQMKLVAKKSART